ncbi:MAG: vWA domain-containing protein [SAR324 cluster bacterium]|nr:vWA domain-containing protein [SAR324 cluster bacterium]
MESDDFPELGPVLEEVCREQLKQELPEALFEQMEQAFIELFQLCQNQEDETILKRCFRTIRRGGVPLKMPKARVELPVHHILRLLQLGFRLGKVNSRFEIRLNEGKRIPMLDGSPLPEEHWHNTMPCVLKHEALGLLHQSGQQALSILDKYPVDEKKDLARKQHLRNKLEPFFFGTASPSRSRLSRPPAISLKQSLIDQSGFPGELLLSETARKVLELQKKTEAPSLFSTDQDMPLREFSVSVVILLDISASTSEQSLYKASQISCSSLTTLLRRQLKKMRMFVIPYNDQPSRPLEALDDFIAPGGTTNYEAVFASAQECIREEKVPGMVINITDGLPDGLDKACRAGNWFPRRGIEYSQIVFGHVDHQDDLIEELMIREGLLPEPEVTSKFKKYISCFSQVTQACSGNQLVIWMLNALPQAMLALADLSLATQWLRQDPNHSGWLESLETPVLVEDI